MRYLSVCSGIEAASVAWHPLGWQAAAYSEIEAFPRAVLAHHYPAVPCHGDFTTIEADQYGPIDLLVGGTPCQDFSVAGLRAGITGDRGNLTLEFLRLAARTKPRWIVWENVPGVLSSDGGRALGAFLGGLGQLGYGFAYRVLDAQYFGLAQRRARVFVVGYLGDWRRAAAVLFERESLLWHPAPSRETGERIAPTISARTKGGGGLGTDFDCDGGLIAPEISLCLNAGGMGRQDSESETLIAHALRAEGFDASEDGTGRGTPLVPVAFNITPSNSNTDYNARASERAQALTAGGNRPSARGGDLIAFSVKDHGADAGPLAPTLRAGGFDKSHANGGVMPAIAFGWQNSSKQGASASASVTPTLDKSKTPAIAFESRFVRNGRGAPDTIVPPLKAQSGQSGKGDAAPLVASAMMVRRLTPRECCRLQGFPDDYLDITYRGRPAADGPKYKALGNSMAVPVMGWIGKRIQIIDAL